MSKKIKNTASRAAKSLGGKGFYIALALCLAVIGVSGYYLYSSINSVTTVLDREPTQITLDDSYLPEDQQADVSVAGPAQVEIEFEDQKDEDVQAVQPEPDRQEDAAPVYYAPTYSRPVSGEVTAAFNTQELVYSETLGDWRLHNGIDISAQLGEHVLSVTSGTVSRVYNDALYGTCVSIDHGNGLVSTYKGLQTTPTVSAGDWVNTGDCIGAVGATSMVESSMDPHLHFEMTLNGVQVNPEDYLP